MHTSLTAGMHPFMAFNRNQTGLNPDFPGLHYHCVPQGDAPLTPDQRATFDSALEFIGSPTDSMQFSCYKFNWQHMGPDTVALVVMLQFSVTTELPLTTPYFIQQIVRQTPNSQPIIVINNPGMCGSSRIPRSIRIDVRAGIFDSLAEAVLVALKSADINHIELLGFSMGARLAMAMGATTVRWDKPDLFPVVHAIAAAEPPGIEAFSLLDFFKRFSQVEGERLAYYQDSTTDTRLKLCVGLKPTEFQQARGFLKAVLPDWKGNWALMTGMRRNSLLPDIEVLEDSEIPTILIQGTRSAISSRLHAPTGSLKLRLLPGDSHAFGEEGRRLAYHLLSAVRGKV